MLNSLFLFAPILLIFLITKMYRLPDVFLGSIFVPALPKMIRSAIFDGRKPETYPKTQSEIKFENVTLLKMRFVFVFSSYAT